MIKPKLEKKCAECGEIFRPYRTTDKYCSLNCKLKSKQDQEKEYQNSKSFRQIKKQSDKTKKKMYSYHKQKNKFMLKHRICPVMKKVFNKVTFTEDIHHKKGRSGDLLLDETYWLAVSREGHRWIHENPEKAYEYGFMIRGK